MARNSRKEFAGSKLILERGFAEQSRGDPQAKSFIIRERCNNGRGDGLARGVQLVGEWARFK